MNEQNTGAASFSFDDPSGDVSRSADEIIDGRPPVTDATVATEPVAAAAPAAATVTDSAGVAFDPALHATGADGLGVKTAKGTWRKKRGTGIPRKLTDPRAKPEPAPDAPRVLTADEINRAKATGAMIAENVITISKLVGGPDFEPRTQPIDDRLMLSEAWQNYCIAQQVVELPPGAFLVAAHLAYIAPRFTMPETQSRLTTLKTKIAAWWIRRKDRRAAKKNQAPPADESTSKGLAS